MATLDLSEEPTVYATCMSWVGINRIVVGHTDGSITLWSIHPEMMLLRCPAHATAVQDICSAYPSNPYMVASRPVEGLSRLIDLTRPSSEHTFHPNPVAGVQTNLLGWSEHMQGFVSASPSNSPLNGKLDFMPLRHYPCTRTIFPHIGGSTPTCLAVGKVHPFVLVGAACGSVWVCNLPDDVFPSNKNRLPRCLVLSSEFRPKQADDKRDIFCAVLLNLEQKIEFQYPKKVSMEISGPSEGANSVDNEGQEEEEEEGSDIEEEEEEDEGGADGETAHEAVGGFVVHEELTAVSAVAWNPSIEYGTWCSIGLSSGVVLIRDMNPYDTSSA